MSRKGRVGFQSALLVSYGAVGGAFGASLLAWWAELPAVAALLLTVSVVGLASRLWGEAALHRVHARLEAERHGLSVGERLTLRYTVENAKAVPLLWLELCQDLAPGDCLEPEEGFVRRLFDPQEAEYAGRSGAWTRRLAFVGGFSRLQWESAWVAKRRGVYRPGELLLRSGDGFGLTQSVGTAPGLSGQALAVWPKIVPVWVGPFLQSVWTGRTSRAGWAEDPSVVRGERAYQPGDSWKRIDWRNAARTGELMVRQFDTVLPLASLFILDAASMPEREEALSLLASVLLALLERGVACGLALPAAGDVPPLLLRPDDPATGRERLLFALADFRAEEALPGQDEAGILAASAVCGQVWLLTEDAGHLSCPGLASRLEARGGLRLLCRTGEGGLPFRRIGRGGT